MKNILFLILCLLANIVLANNIKVENVSITNQNSTSNVKDIKFDISWDNSWRISAAPYNYYVC